MTEAFILFPPTAPCTLHVYCGCLVCTNTVMAHGLSLPKHFLSWAKEDVSEFYKQQRCQGEEPPAQQLALIDPNMAW